MRRTVGPFAWQKCNTKNDIRLEMASGNNIIIQKFYGQSCNFNAVKNAFAINKNNKTIKLIVF